MLRITTIICLALLPLVGCKGPAAEDGRDDRFLAGGKSDTGGIVEGSPEAAGILRFVNAAGYDLLVDEVGLADRPAANIVNFKLGDDGLYGSYDDRAFVTLQQLDDVPYVGTKVFAALLDYAGAHGYVWVAEDAGVWNVADAQTWSYPDAQTWSYPDAQTWSYPDAQTWSYPDAQTWSYPDAQTWYYPDAQDWYYPDAQW